MNIKSNRKIQVVIKRTQINDNLWKNKFTQEISVIPELNQQALFNTWTAGAYTNARENIRK